MSEQMTHPLQAIETMIHHLCDQAKGAMVGKYVMIRRELHDGGRIGQITDCKYITHAQQREFNLLLVWLDAKPDEPQCAWRSMGAIDWSDGRLGMETAGTTAGADLADHKHQKISDASETCSTH